MFKHIVSASALSALFVMSAAAAPPAELAQLAFFNGDWTCVGKAPAHDSTPERTTHTSVHVAPALDGMWQQYVISDVGTDGKPFHFTMYHSYDSAKKAFVSVGLDNAGGYEIQNSPGWNGDTLVFEKKAGDGGPADRDTITKKSATELTHLGEWQDKDGSWKKAIEHVCHRTKAK